jgi:aldose 1-epimerase
MKRLKDFFLVSILLILLVIINNNCQSDKMKIAEGVVFPVPEKFEKIVNGKQVSLFTLENPNGMKAGITNYGGKVVSLLVADRNGVFDDVVTGYHTIDEYFNSGEIYFGALIGRYGNRIGGAEFSLDGENYNLAANNGPNHLHGGPGGFHNVIWDAEMTATNTLELTYLSPHMEEGYPGNLSMKVVYTLTDENELIIEYHASTDRKTVLNPTSHSFFNLGGEGSSSINDHVLRINAENFTPVDETLIPTGEIEPVEGTPFDFREYTPIGERVDQINQQLLYGKGYDHNFVLVKDNYGDLSFAASVYHPDSGRMMDIYTTEPGIQFYGGNFLDGQEIGKRGEPYLFRTSFCLETQHFPDSPNKPEFPSTVLDRGEEFYSKTIHRFTLK